MGHFFAWIFEWLIVAPLCLWAFCSVLFGRLGGNMPNREAERAIRLQAARRQARIDAEDRLIRRYYGDR